MSGFTVGSLFSGVGGFEQGFEAAGFRTAWQCEIDNDAVSVLERHWPDVRRFRDVSEVDPSELEPVDVVVFGSPCQDMSVAGKRGGLAGERSGLFHEAVRIIGGLRPAPSLVIWENVPGALSSAGGRDFGAVLDALADIGAVDISWRVLDAQWFGVPQRRRRIFLVADFGGERAASVLFESESVRGDSQASGEARQDAARDAEDGTGSGGVANSLLSYAGRNQLEQTYVPMSGEAVRDCLTAHGGSHGRIDAESETFVVAATWDHLQQTSPVYRSGPVFGAPSHTLHSAGLSVVTHALTTRSGATEDGTGRGTPRVAYPAVGFAQNQRGEVVESSYSHQLTAGGGKPGEGYAAVRQGMSVRRLTPRECERLMGYPDDWTRWRADGREIPDGPRYRMCGNGVAAPVAEWVARRAYEALEATA